MSGTVGACEEPKSLPKVTMGALFREMRPFGKTLLVTFVCLLRNVFVAPLWCVDFAARVVQKAAPTFVLDPFWDAPEKVNKGPT